MPPFKLRALDRSSLHTDERDGEPACRPAAGRSERRLPTPPAPEPSFVMPSENGAARHDITCFVAGTMILTVSGEKPVEALRPGELLLTMHDLPCRRPLLGIRCSRVDLAQLPDPAALAPVLIRAGALMKGSPIRDLRVSPGQGILLDGHLVPARLLVNGTTIRQESMSDRVAYYYLWMGDHDLLIADGTLAESSFTGERRRDYGEATNVTTIEPATGEPTPSARCVPQLTEGPQLTLIQQRLAVLARGSAPIH